LRNRTFGQGSEPSAAAGPEGLNWGSFRVGDDLTWGIGSGSRRAVWGQCTSRRLQVQVPVFGWPTVRPRAPNHAYRTTLTWSDIVKLQARRAKTPAVIVVASPSWANTSIAMCYLYSCNAVMPNEEELLAEIERLRAENERLKRPKRGRSAPSVSRPSPRPVQARESGDSQPLV